MSKKDNDIRMFYDEKQYKFSVIDIISLLVDVPSEVNYWKIIKKRIKNEGGYISVEDKKSLYSTIETKDNKKIEIANLQQIFRIIQSIPSTKAEKIKLWMANEISLNINNDKEFINILKNIINK